MYSSNSDTRTDRFTRHKVPRFRKDDEQIPARRLGTYRGSKRDKKSLDNEEQEA